MVIDLFDDAPEIARRARAEGLTVVILALRPLDDGQEVFERWVVEGSTRLLTALKDVVMTIGDDEVARVAVIISAESLAPEPASAAAAAVDGIVQSLTLECGSRLRLNSVSCGLNPSDTFEATLELLSGEVGGFLAGSSFDLSEDS